MIQRIQTFYLSVAAILIMLLGFIEMASISVGNEIFSFNLLKLTEAAENGMTRTNLELIILGAAIVLIEFFIIFKFKNRVLQMRLSTYNIILMLGLVGLSWWKINSAFSDIDGVVVAYRISMAFPIVGVILNYLAIRSIGKDEALVRSVDRIR